MATHEPTVDTAQALADLQELRRLTEDSAGAQRVAWTDTWTAARDWLLAQLKEIDGVSVDRDQAGNIWATAPGDSERSVIIGGHLDSVPNGGWLDGALGTVAGLEILRALAPERRALTIKLVDWADEEGARFGRSLLGSSAAAGTLDLEQVRGLTDRDGVALPDALAACGVQLDRMHEAGDRLTDVAAYLELHIEQGPILEEQGVPLAAVLGTVGVERHAVTFRGRASHAGSTPMRLRRDAFLSAARFALEAREGARRHGAVATCGAVSTEPGIVTAIAGACTVSLDQRALDADVLAAMLAEARDSAERIAAEEGTTVAWEPLFQIAPIPFHPTLVGFAEEAGRAVAGAALRLPSGPLHDAAEMARLAPTAMMFVTSLDGISHSPAEDTPLDHLELAVRAFAALTARTVAWVASGSGSA